MGVYREFIVDENTRAVEVHCIDEATGSEVPELIDFVQPRFERMDWALLVRPELDLAYARRSRRLERV